MIARLAWHELRHQLRGRVFWIVFTVSVLMVAGALAIDQLRVGVSEEGARTGAAAILRTHLVWTLFFLFTAAALVGEVALRDASSGFTELVCATPVSPAAYAFGRFLGALGAVLLCFTSVPLAMMAAGWVLGFGMGHTGAYLFAFFALALPNLFLASALFFASIGLTRSMKGCLVGAATLLTVYGLASDGRGTTLVLMEPFAFAAVTDVTRGWSLTQRDAMWPALGGTLLVNRLGWLGVAAGLVGLGTWLAARGEGSRRPRRSRRTGVENSLDPAGKTRELRIASHKRSRWRIVALQVGIRTEFETRRVIGTPVFAALLLMGLVSAAAATSRVAGTPATLATLANSFQLVPIVVALFFAGELFWAEREHGVAPIVAATAAHRAVLVLPKVLAMGLVLLLLAVASAAAGAVTQIVKGHPVAPNAYLAWYIVPKAYEWLLFGILALFLQSLAPSKLAGWGYVVFYLIGSLALSRLGWEDPLYRYGGYPGAPLPPALSGASGVSWYRLGWGLVAATMLMVACGRGLPDQWKRSG